jgi:hypothetical protein
MTATRRVTGDDGATWGDYGDGDGTAFATATATVTL